MTNFLANLHSFVIYSYFGTLVILFLTYLFIRIFRVTSPKLKARAYFIALITPGLTFLVAHLFSKACSYGSLPWDIGSLAVFYGELCRIGGKATDFLVPFFMLAIFVGVTKALISILVCRRLIAKYGYADETEYPHLFTILKRAAQNTGITVPKIILTADDYARAFTFGIKQPIIVLSTEVLLKFSNDEIEQILSHECAHIKRLDVFTNWLGVMIRDISFFNPFAHIVFTRFVAAKEEASDDLALKTGLNPLEYGTTLIKMWRMSKENTFLNLAFENISPSPGFLKKAATFEMRVQRMLNWQKEIKEPKYFWAILAIVAVFTSMFLISIC